MAELNDIILENGMIAYRNFSGRPTEYKPEGGIRTVTFVIPDEWADDLRNDGWKIRYEEKKERFLLEATVLYRTKDGRPKDPKVFIVRDDNKLIHMTEETVGELDSADIVSVDAVIGPSRYNFGGKTGIKAYVNSLYIKIRENPIERKYRQMLDDMDASFNADDLPFPID
jgi:hypothetical protein